MQGPLFSLVEKMALTTFSLSLRNPKWLTQRTRFFFFKPSVLPSYNVGSRSPRFSGAASPRNTHIPTVSPSPSKPWGSTPWEQEPTHPGALNGRRQEGGEEEPSVGARKKIEPLKIAKPKSPREILHCRSHLPSKSLLIWGMTLADLIFCHQSLRTCFNYAAHQQTFSF